MSQVKTRQSQSYKFQKIAKTSNFKILQETLHGTHFLKFLDKMCKYEMDPTRTVGATEQTRDAGWTDGVKPTYPSTPLFRGGYTYVWIKQKGNHKSAIWCQPTGGHVSYPTDSPATTRLRLCNSLPRNLSVADRIPLSLNQHTKLDSNTHAINLSNDNQLQNLQTPISITSSFIKEYYVVIIQQSLHDIHDLQMTSFKSKEINENGKSAVISG